MHLADLSDDAILKEVDACVVFGRENDARLLQYLAEVDSRRLYLARACSSLYDFCKRKLGFTDNQAFRRVACARLVKDHPFLVSLIAKGLTNMSALTQIRPFITRENVHALVADTAGKNRDEIDYMLAQRFNLARPIRPSRGVLVIDEELDKMMTRAFEISSHAVPDGDRLKLTKRVYRAYIAEQEKKLRAKAARPRPPPSQPTKTIPRASSRHVFETYGEQCCFVDSKTGERCPSRVYLQRNHRVMRAYGGGHEPANLDSMCGPHNRYLAMLAMGRERYERAIRLRQQRSEKSGGGEPPPAGVSRPWRPPKASRASR